MLTQHSLPPLSHVEIRTSGIIPAPISDVRLLPHDMMPLPHVAVPLAVHKPSPELSGV